MTGKHTPGSLTYQADGCDGHPAVMRTLEGGDSEPIAVGINGCTEADLRQMAAAPDMLEALRRVLLAVEDIGAHGPGATRDEIIERMHRDDSGVLRQARAAIRKATGGEGGAR